MTGFARTEDYNEHCSWTWEVRSVNGKGLDVRSRVPSGFENLEATARDHVKKSLSRGNISISLSVKWVRKGQAFAINEDILNNYVNLLPQLSQRFPDATPVSMDGLLSLKGVIEFSDQLITEDAQKNLEIALLSSLDDTLIALQAMRADEGKILSNILNQQVHAIFSLCKAAAKVAATQPEAIRKCLKSQVASLLEDVSSLSPERLEQEAALLMTKADVSEELDRLGAHVVAAQDLLKLDSAIGRKLDFICQEFNREANTLCSKSGDMELTRIGLDMKATIEKFREQVQNIE
jgi:uncharacterized protein (TIGR00255 family)